MSEVSWETFLAYPDGDEMAGVRISEPSRMRASRSAPRRFVHLLNHCGSQVTTRMGIENQSTALELDANA